MMRFLCFIAIVILSIVENSEGATQASCKNSTGQWTLINQEQILKSCRPEINEVHTEDFRILSARDPVTFGFYIQDKDGVEFLPTNLFDVFPALIAVAVQNCSVTDVKEIHFKGLSKLRSLSLGQNKIEHIASDAFDDLVSLEFLSLNDNRIQSLGKNTFAPLKALEELFLEGNEIQLLHPKIFSSLVNVEGINLDRNEILSLDENIFENLISLQNISMSSNKLEKIPLHLFKNNLKLTMIWFDNNKIKCIDGCMFDHLMRLNYVDLEGNLCSNEFYIASDFGDMRNDLKQNCTANPIEA